MPIWNGREKVIAWLKAARFPFHPMAFIAYSMGAAAASASHGRFDLSVYLLGYLVLFLIELCTIFCNEYFDYETDRVNRNFSMFTGGTRMLVEGRLTFGELRAGIFAVLVLIAGLLYPLVRTAQAVSPVFTLVLMGIGLLLGLGYTVPPLKLSYRGLGEIVVGSTHSFYLVLCGFVFQTGIWKDPLPWLLSVPLFFSVLAANTLAGIPDRLADRETGKKSIAVIFGPRPAVIAAAGFVIAAALGGILLWGYPVIDGIPGPLILIVVPHAAILLASLHRFHRSGNYDRRIDKLMASALSYIIWFGLIPLASMVWG